MHRVVQGLDGIAPEPDSTFVQCLPDGERCAVNDDMLEGEEYEDDDMQDSEELEDELLIEDEY